MKWFGVLLRKANVVFTRLVSYSLLLSGTVVILLALFRIDELLFRVLFGGTGLFFLGAGIYYLRELSRSSYHGTK